MDEEIEFLRELGEDLRAIARDSRGRPARRWGRPLVALASSVLALAVVGGVLWTSFIGPGPDRPLRPAPGEEGRVSGRGEGPPPPPSGQWLRAVDATGPDDVWAVGERYDGETFRSESLILRWDGSTWTEVPHPDVGGLGDVVAVSSDEAWAIGGERRVLRWDGSAWTVSPLPNVEGMTLAAIDASGPDDAWAVGMRYGARWIDEYGERNVGFDTLTLHWDGTAWTVVPSPNGAPRHNFVEAVVALGPDDAWVVGYSQRGRHPRTMTMHWDGTSWELVPSPNPGSDFDVLWGGGDDGQGGVWAVGHYGDPDSRFMALYLRWTGAEWEVVQAPSGEAVHQTPTALSGSSAGDVWAVGSEPTSSFLVARWDGSRWAAIDVELPPGSETWSAALSDVVAISPSEAWAVGRNPGPPDEEGRSHIFALVLRWDGTAWRPVDVPDPG